MADRTPQETAERVLADCRADACVVIVEQGGGTHLRWAANTVTASGSADVGRTTVIALRNTREGTSAGVVSHSGVHGVDTSRIAEEAWRSCSGNPVVADAPALPGPGEVPVGSAAEWRSPAPAPPEDPLGNVPEELRSAFARARAEGRLLHGYAERHVRTTYLASSTGVRLRHTRPTALLDLTMRGVEDPATSWAGDSATTAPDTPFPEGWVTAMDDRLRARPRRTRRSACPPGRYEVILSPSCVADLMLHLYRELDADDALHGRTVFGRPGGGTRLGERLTSQPLALSSDPALPGMGAVPFVVARGADGAASVFDSGLSLGATDWIADGVLNTLVHDRRSALRAGVPVSPRIDNLRLEGPADAPSLADMVASTRRGLLVTSLWYLRQVDAASLRLTGLTRDGVYLVEDGEVTGTVGNSRFDESPVGLLERVTEVGRSTRTLPREWGDCTVRTAMPPLRVADFALSAATTSV
ncbi:MULTISPECIES: metallopeptidase TldD-related protein [Nocardiopsis]|uniref:Metalloprotease TldD/E C-terminal domain-containing protein n=1 Tax=Nocardiopsis sinuspersici TaxID=501010 RepID=A0A1V3BY52_9ACTN|nr:MULTISPECIES: metallopeptidase TldD-related protein [Nocardiopsis]OOC53353.1 hypothetical protein NOSIN_05635 [Nocardiopsis sinuspersici]